MIQFTACYIFSHYQIVNYLFALVTDYMDKISTLQIDNDKYLYELIQM